MILTSSLGVISVVAVTLAWQGQEKLKDLERELVRRQAGSQSEASEARALARAAQELSRDSAAKIALLDARLAEVALQRGQLEELIQSMSRSRDENVIGDIEASIRVAMQQSSITGSAEPMVATLRQADERLQRYKQPRLDGVRRAVARDLDRVKAISVADVSTLTIKLDEVVRLLDELPLLSSADKSAEQQAVRQRRSERAASAAAPVAAAPTGDWWEQAQQRWQDLVGQVWIEAKGLLRVTRIDHPEAMLLAPDQTFFLRENAKLRLLNARLALLSRQFDTAQTDLRDTLTILDRYFDGRSRKVQAASDLLRQVVGQARQVNVPRPDDTLAALAAAGAGR
ncbi:uroporphyrinogen-III C-methyltransferase [Roseateles sp.]|uniref:uroporphyrinogen-III C-methyltransferase n=1 Tax=Roseateles sp. TaxID=1971397 RepID=UPI0037CCC068